MDVHPESDFLITATRNQEGEKDVRSVVIVQDILEIQTQKLISLDKKKRETLLRTVAETRPTQGHDTIE